jgi:autotransporter-associated beta strand protein
VAFTGPISGPGGLEKVGAGTLVFSGTSTNTYAGVTTVSLGRLELNKTNASAISGLLVIGDDEVVTNNATVQMLVSEQIADTATVNVRGSGVLGFGLSAAQTETIGSLQGNGRVNLLLGTLTVGGNNLDSSFFGIISGVGTSPLVKTGFGSFTLNGANNCSGTTVVNAGRLVVNGALPGPMQVNFLSFLGGTGIVGNLSTTLGHLTPGDSVGKITTGNLAINNGSSSLDLQLNGPTAGLGYDQIAANGSVSITNAGLNIAMGFPGSIGAHYVVISNDGFDAVAGTFGGLPEGTMFVRGGVQFKISYKGGDGNDVELTQLSVGQSQIGGISRLGNGQIQFSGSGIPGLAYTVEANVNLATTNWVNIGSALADPNGVMSFVDADAPNHAMRFYRFKAP